MLREGFKKIKILLNWWSALLKNLPIKFPNKKGLLVLTPTLLKCMSLFLYKEKLGFFSDTYLPLGTKSCFLLFFFEVVPKKYKIARTITLIQYNRSWLKNNQANIACFTSLRVLTMWSGNEFNIPIFCY